MATTANAMRRGERIGRHLEPLHRSGTHPVPSQAPIERPPVELAPEHPWRGGTRAVVLDRDDLHSSASDADPHEQWPTNRVGDTHLDGVTRTLNGGGSMDPGAENSLLFHWDLFEPGLFGFCP